MSLTLLRVKSNPTRTPAPVPPSLASGSAPRARRASTSRWVELDGRGYPVASQMLFCWPRAERTLVPLPGVHRAPGPWRGSRVGNACRSRTDKLTSFGRGWAPLYESACASARALCVGMTPRSRAGRGSDRAPRQRSVMPRPRSSISRARRAGYTAAGRGASWVWADSWKKRESGLLSSSSRSTAPLLPLSTRLR